METAEHFFSTSRTARYYLWGDVTAPVRTLWYLLHGYGHKADDFLEMFPMLKKEGNVLVVPEGLSRFYVKGFSGRTGASWMTRDMREHEIRDTVQMLDSLATIIQGQLAGQPKQTVVLGFSQGAPAAARWLSLGHMRADGLVLYASDMPADADIERIKERMAEGMKLYQVMGDKDEFIDADRQAAARKFMKDNTLEYKAIDYEGTHEVNPEAMQRLLKELHL